MAQCFNYITSNPPKPLTEVEIWFQIGHVYEQKKDFAKAKEIYERVLQRNPEHAKVLQQLGWLHHQQSGEADQELAVQWLTKSLASDGSDAQSWYLLGRCFMVQRKYNRAYEAYQQAVYRDGRNPSFWCSIGVLYYQINQYRDALDAYSRAIRLNPYISEVWYDLGTLYESCNDQVNDALDAYARAADLDPHNPHIKARLEALKSGQLSGARNSLGGPVPQDVNPNAYQSGGPSSHSWNGHPAMHSSQQQHQQQGPPPPPPSAASHQHQHQHQQAPNSHRRGSNTPASEQTPFRGAESQSMRPPHSPDRSKLQNGHGHSRNGTQKVDAPAPLPPYQQTQHHAHQSPYPPSHPTGPSIASLNHGGDSSAPSGGASLAPMLGRTSPVSEIRSLQSRDDGTALREQPPTPAPSQQNQQNGGRSHEPVVPRAEPREQDANTLKRPREWDDHSSAPEPKKQEMSESSSRQDGREAEMAKTSSETSRRTSPVPLDGRPSSRPSESERNTEQTSRQQQEQPPQEQTQDSESHRDVQSVAREDASIATPVVPEERAGEERRTASAEPVAAIPAEAEKNESKTNTNSEGEPLPPSEAVTTPIPPQQESAERKIEVDENYDDDD